MSEHHVWYRIGSTRRNPSWATVMRSGTKVPLPDELHAAEQEMAEPLSRLRHEWLPHVPDDVGTPGWREEMHEPVLLAVALDFQIQAPDLWAPIETQLLGDEQYAEARRRVDEVQALLDRARDFESAAGGVSAVPTEIGLLLRGGARELDAYAEPLHTGGAIPLVDDRFEHALIDAGLTSGWTTEAIELRDRKGERVTTHRLLVVRARVSDQPEVIESHNTASGSVEPPVALELHRPHGRTRAVHVSAAAVDALEKAGLPGLSFEASEMTSINP